MESNPQNPEFRNNPENFHPWETHHELPPLPLPELATFPQLVYVSEPDYSAEATSLPSQYPPCICGMSSDGTSCHGSYGMPVITIPYVAHDQHVTTSLKAPEIQYQVVQTGNYV